ncbi:hypothetical protein TUM12370_13860 [Salmonella enterica subsp. enterica serovar Choleraesuis]|nr:hypothetical protein TUM12370_13860 [Salmonella enterica subsp. enterica serovar Choleraesuis]
MKNHRASESSAAEMDQLLKNIYQIDETEMTNPGDAADHSKLPAEGDIGGHYEWDLNDGCINEHGRK